MIGLRHELTVVARTLSDMVDKIRERTTSREEEVCNSTVASAYVYCGRVVRIFLAVDVILQTVVIGICEPTDVSEKFESQVIAVDGRNIVS